MSGHHPQHEFLPRSRSTPDCSKAQNFHKSPARSPNQSAWALSPGRAPRKPETKTKEEKISNGVMGFLMKRKKSKENFEKEEMAHRLRIMSCRLLQWRFVNARRESAARRQRSTNERKIFFAWLKINELQNIVAAKKMTIQRRKQKMKLAQILNPQLYFFINYWDPLSGSHLDAVTELSTVLQSICMPLPLIDGAQANLVLLHDYISTSINIMPEIETAIKIFYSKVEEVSTTLNELVEIVVQELEKLEELMNTGKRFSALEMQETSLRANLIQATKEEVELPPLSTFRLQSWMQNNLWPIY